MKFKKLNKFSKKQKIVVGVMSFLLVSVISFNLLKSAFANPDNNYLADQTIDGISFENAKLNYNNGISNYTVEVINDNNKDYDLKTINVVFKDSKGKEITTLLGYLGENLSANEKRILEISTDNELSNVKSINYLINK